MKLPTRMWPKGQKWAEYDEIVPAGTPLSAIMCRDYWVHAEKYLRPFDVVTCVAEDFSFHVDICLMSKTATSMKWLLLREAPTTVLQQLVRRDAPEERYVVKSGGRAGGWRVLEKATGNIVADGLDKPSADAEKERLEAEQTQPERQAA